MLTADAHFVPRRAPPGIRSKKPARLGTHVVAPAVVAILAITGAYCSAYRSLGLGVDYWNYVAFYEILRADDAFDAYRFELGFKYAASVAKFVLEFDVGQFIMALILAALALKMSVLLTGRNVYGAAVFYLLAWYPLHEYTQFRIAVAISFCFVAMVCLLQSRWLLAGALFVSGLLFHSSIGILAPVVAVAYLFRHRPTYQGVLAILGLAVVVDAGYTLTFDYLRLLNPLSDSYVAVDEFAAPKVFSAANIVMVCALVAAALTGGVDEPRTKVLFLITVASLPLFIALLEVPAFAQRVRELLMCFSTLVLFDRQLSARALPQMSFAFVFAFAQTYSATTYGLMGD